MLSGALGLVTWKETLMMALRVELVGAAISTETFCNKGHSLAVPQVNEPLVVFHLCRLNWRFLLEAFKIHSLLSQPFLKDGVASDAEVRLRNFKCAWSLVEDAEGLLVVVEKEGG